jgi:endonuclease/exonuclease/phosphatase family metal-dependent hydrolase
MYWAMLAMAPAMAGAEVPHAAAATQSYDISVLTYNVKGLPWPVAPGRAKALKAIGAELAALRREGRQPDVVLLQEGFRSEVADLVQASGYAYWAEGPRRGAQPPAEARRHGVRASLRYALSGEGLGKLTGGGLHVLSDLPIVKVESRPYAACAGFDCLANKGAMLVRVALNGVPVEVDLVNTHLNSRRAAKVPLARSLAAHNRQTEELLDFIADNASAERPLLVGGDFNVKNAPDRYYHKAAERPFTVVSEYCAQGGACVQPARGERPWLASQDLQAFAGPVRPLAAGHAFDGRAGARLSDHDGYVVRYRLSWTPEPRDQARLERGLQVRPQFKTLGARVSYTY